MTTAWEYLISMAIPITVSTIIMLRERIEDIYSSIIISTKTHADLPILYNRIVEAEAVVWIVFGFESTESFLTPYFMAVPFLGAFKTVGVIDV